MSATSPVARHPQISALHLSQRVTAGVTGGIAGLLGATREATSKTLADFASQGIIRQGRGRITVQNVAALRSMARPSA